MALVLAVTLTEAAAARLGPESAVHLGPTEGERFLPRTSAPEGRLWVQACLDGARLGRRWLGRARTRLVAWGGLRALEHGMRKRLRVWGEGEGETNRLRPWEKRKQRDQLPGLHASNIT